MLAGGAAARLGGLDKTAELVAGRSLLSRVLDALVDAGTVLVVGGAPGPRAGVRSVVEQPPGGGPAHAVAAGLEFVTGQRVVLLAGDLPFVTATAVAHLVNALARPDVDVAAAVDDAGRAQYLLAAWHAEALRTAIRGAGGTYGASLRAVYRQARMHGQSLEGVPPPWWDCDTAEQLAAARAWSEESNR